METLEPEDASPHALDVPGLLRRYGLRPDKSLGQNFLVSPAALARVVAAAGIQPSDLVLEIGPGLGSLTRLLAGLARQVVAVELDARLLSPLQEVLAPFSNVQLVQGDILRLNSAQLLSEWLSPQPGPVAGYRVVANIPYYITSALIRHLLEAGVRPQSIVLTVQQEVAGRICAAPGDLSLLALSVQVYGSARIEAHIPARAFYPVPKVDSAVVRIDLYLEPLIPPAELTAFFRLAKAGFSQKRKTLRNSLAGEMHWKPLQAETLLQSAGIDPQRRAESLSIREWAFLTKMVIPHLSP